MREFKVSNLLTDKEKGLFQNQLFRQIFDDSSEAILIIDLVEFTILDCNRKAVKLFQAKEPSDLCGKQYFTLYSSEPVTFSKSHIRQILQAGEKYSQELSLRTLRNQTFWGSITIKKLLNVDSNIAILRINKLIDYVKGEETLASLIKKTSKHTGIEFFRELTKLLTTTFDISFAFVGTLTNDGKFFRVLEYYSENYHLENLTCQLDNSPLENTLRGYTSFYPKQLKELFPDDNLLDELDIESYFGTPVYNSSGEVQGALVLMDTNPMTEVPNARYILSVFSSRVGAEIERLKVIELLREQDEKIEQLEQMNRELNGSITADEDA